MKEEIYKRYGEKTRTCFSHSPEEVAPWLLGKRLCRKGPDGAIRRFSITETEAYHHEDSACYKKSDATAPLLEKGGTCCVYGEMLLIACGDKGETDNVLIRRAGDKDTYCPGPVLLCEELGIGKDLHGADLLTSDQIWLEGDDTERDYCQTQRVGLGQTVKETDRDRRNRFILL